MLSILHYCPVVFSNTFSSLSNVCDMYVLCRFVLAAVSPAVVVPSLLLLDAQGYGVDKGIPTLVIAASSIDDVIAITGFGVVLGITFSTGSVQNSFKGLTSL